MSLTIKLPEKLEELSLDLLQSSGEIKDPREQSLYILKYFNPKVDFSKIDEDTIMAMMLSIAVDIEQHKIPPPENSFKLNGIEYKLPSNLLNTKLGHYIEAINAKIKDGSYENWNLIAACLYREDHSMPFNEDEIINNAILFWRNSCKIGYWGVKKHSELLNLLRSTFPILYESKGSTADKEEGVRGYEMLNSVANNQVLKWEDVKNIRLANVFHWLSINEKNRQIEEQHQRINRIRNKHR